MPSLRAVCALCRYFHCLCARCEDPTELGSHLSSLVCPKCPGVMTQAAPLATPPGPWKCPAHNFTYAAAAVDAIVADLKAHFLEHVGFTAIIYGLLQMLDTS